MSATEKAVDLPGYIWENGKRYWLTISADIQGYWNVGYSTNGEVYLAWSTIGKNKSIDEALRNLAGAYDSYWQSVLKRKGDDV